MRVIQKPLLRRFKLIAEENDVSVEDVKTIEASIWEMVASKIKEGVPKDKDSFHSIYIKGLGTFHFSEGKWRHVNKVKK